MIVPSIDLLDGRAVQLRQGREPVLTSPHDPVQLAREFGRYGEVAVIDLNAARGDGDNLDLICRICRVAQARVGGGIRTIERARQILRAGAHRIIIGTAADPEMLSKLPAHYVIVALDHRNGEVVDRGWTNHTGETVFERAKRLSPYCGGFLCTFVDDEGTMRGMDVSAVDHFKSKLNRPLTVAGGVAGMTDVIALLGCGVDVQVGMALYTGQLDLAECVVQSIDFGKKPLVPTIVQDTDGQVLMLAHSSPESLRLALREGRGVYFSRSRGLLWTKGLTSGNTQELISCRTDCDRDTLLFTVRQTGVACHEGSYSCFGERRHSQSVLFELLGQRRREMPSESYSVRYFNDRPHLLRKIMEEAYEVTTANGRAELVWEMADLLYFLSLLAVDEGLEWSDITDELRGRQR
ncbi:MAG: phosphoribosyl-ATP diphosphatase [candidate division Zixibacteria bacterium]|nr:phosphoribosyl-ATP diphosphatase [candidate division Zixibacteria bacterium]